MKADALEALHSSETQGKKDLQLLLSAAAPGSKRLGSCRRRWRGAAQRTEGGRGGSSETLAFED